MKAHVVFYKGIRLLCGSSVNKVDITTLRPQLFVTGRAVFLLKEEEMTRAAVDGNKQTSI